VSLAVFKRRSQAEIPSAQTLACTPLKNLLRLFLPLLAALLALAPVSEAAEIQDPEEVLALEVHAKGGFTVYAQLYPRRHVALIEAQRGVMEAERPQGKWRGAAYAVYATPAGLRDRVNVQIGHVGTIVGRFVREGASRRGHQNPSCRGRRPIFESGRFVGQIAFKGDGGYLRVSRGHALAYRQRSFRLRCKPGHTDHHPGNLSGLFSYIEAPLTLSSSDASFLQFSLVTRSRVTEVLALHHLFEESSTFEARDLEWLPGGVATTRWVEVSRVAESSFAVDESERHPRSATLAPPFPFHGEATYTRKRHELRGDLRLSFLGKTLPLTGKVDHDGICRRTPKMRRWVCR
jgi:hypothetical protein